MAAKSKGGKCAQKQDDGQFEKLEEAIDEQELASLYAWVDSIPLSRPKRNISRDFSDGGKYTSNELYLISLLFVTRTVAVSCRFALANIFMFDFQALPRG